MRGHLQHCYVQACRNEQRAYATLLRAQTSDGPYSVRQCQHSQVSVSLKTTTMTTTRKQEVRE